METEIVRSKYPSLGLPNRPMRAYARSMITPTAASSMPIAEEGSSVADESRGAREVCACDKTSKRYFSISREKHVSVCAKATTFGRTMADVEPVEEELCRYCFEGEDDEAGELLRDICACAGGQRCVHLSCLRRWQRMVLVSQPTHPAFYQDDLRHHRCNVCASPFKIPPPTRHELMASFTGAEIAALISEGCVIGSHRDFDAQLSQQLRTLDPLRRLVSGTNTGWGDCHVRHPGRRAGGPVRARTS